MPPTLDLSALTSEEKEELRIRLEARLQYEAASAEERIRIEERARLEADFSAFVKSGWAVIRPGMKLDWSWHYDLIGEHLSLCYQRKIKRLIINISPRTLKALSLDTPIPTPTGIMPLRDVHAGMLVYGADGKPTRVLDESPVYHDSECYEVQFATGEKIIADAGHLWETEARTLRPGIGRKVGAPKGKIKGKYGECGYKSKGYKSPSRRAVRTTREIAETQRIGKRSNHSVRVASAVENPEQPLLIPPYVLGAWLGDGTSRCAQITIGEEDAEAMQRNIAADGEQIHFVGYKNGTKNGTYRLGPLEFKWKRTPETFTSRLEMLGVRSNKHIPECYFLGSEAQRLALLQGLMDTDGSAAKNGELTFAACNERLARQVQRLVCSLGMKAAIHNWPARISRRIVGHVWSVSFWAYSDRPVFQLQRKVARQKDRGKTTLQGNRYITAVRPVASVPVKCLSVDNADSLFLVSEGYIPTHNSILVSVFFPVWVWTKQPEHGFAAASYSQDLSTEHSVMRRNLIESDWFKQRWGDRIWLASDQNQKTKFKNNFQAQMIATSVGGTATGLGGNTLIVDDGLNPKQAASEAERKTCHDWFDNTWRSRMNNPAEDALIVMEQRTGELDLTGHLLEADETLEKQGHKREWTHLAIPLECDAEAGPQRYVFPISKKIIEREVGDVLQPTRFPKSVVAELKVRRLVWATQYQQRPSPLEGNLIKRSEVRYYGGRDPVTGELDRALPDKFDMILVSVDCTFKDEKTSDFVATGTIGVKGPDRYVLELTNLHLDEPATRTEILRQKKKWRASTVIVEDKANGSSVIKNLRREISGVIAIEPEGGKFARMFVAAGAWQAGNWYVDRVAAITEVFIEQLTKFPSARHDDMADMMSQAEIYIANRGYKFGLVAHIKAKEEEMKKRKEQRFKQADPKNLADAIENSDTIAPVDDLAKLTTPEMSKPAVDDTTPRCQACGSTLLQRIPGGKRCGNCGVQYMESNLIAKPMAGQLRK